MILSDIAEYVTEKVNSDKITLNQYVTTDSLLQNKRGRQTAQNLPSMPCVLTSYSQGDILISNIRPYLKKIWFADSNGGCSTDVLVFRAKKGHSSNFLFALLMQDAFFSYMMQGSKGSKMPRGDKNQIMHYKVPTFSSFEEENIGNIIVNIERKIALNRQINDNLEAMAKQLYDYWFVQFDFPNEEGKPYKSSGGIMLNCKELGRVVPEGWGHMQIKDFCKTYSGGTPKSTERSYYENGDIPWINSGELNEPYITSTNNFITQLGLDNSSAKYYPSNSVLVAMYGATAGKVSILTFEACSNQAICGVIPNESKYIYYVRFYLDSMYQHFVSISTGSARDNISQDTIKNTIVPIPNTNVLEKFATIVDPIVNRIVANLKENDNLIKQRDELLPLLMNGQVSVAQLNYHLKALPFYRSCQNVSERSPHIL